MGTRELADCRTVPDLEGIRGLRYVEEVFWTQHASLPHFSVRIHHQSREMLE